MNLIRRIFLVFSWLFLACFALGVIGIFLVILTIYPTIPRTPDSLDAIINLPPTEIFASDGSQIGSIGGRTYVPFERISKYYLNAVVSVEDDQFFTHPGIDKPALLKATAGMLLGGRSRGGSTITQQLAKNLFFSFRKSTSRKFREILVALEIERRFSKEKILEAYCNGIPFTANSYGIEDAARELFDVHASDLTLAQSALLAGLPNAPAYYNPYRHPERAIKRQRLILRRMRQHNLISESQYEQALDEPLQYKSNYRSSDDGSYFLETILDDLEGHFDRDVIYHGGLKIYTTFDPYLQSIAVSSARERMNDLDRRFELAPFREASPSERVNYPQTSLVAMETTTGAVRALVGGRDWRASQFNRAVSRNRNMGSSLKPALYLTAIEKLAYHPATVVLDSPIVIDIPGSSPWRPRNFSSRFRGRIILKYALNQSINTVAARLIQAVTPQSMIETIHRLGVEAVIAPHYAIALGATSVSTVEMAGMVASIADMGESVKPFFITRVEGPDGKVLYEHLIERKRNFAVEDVYLLVDMMQGVIETGTGRSVKNYGFSLPAIGKTGTSNDYRDSWFIGATPYLASAAWVGFDDNRPMKLPDGRMITGASGALPVWATFMSKATEGEPVRDFPVPEGISFQKVPVHFNTGMTGASADSMFVALPKGVELTFPDMEADSTDALPGRELP